ncbi:MAG: hypothetical protein BZ151_10190 [Desulfobacca sp. 4484_104]|nr:MAG: hypothetical protein BZ151_10190 [Desulfobacca sp. 4484_104]
MSLVSAPDLLAIVLYLRALQHGTLPATNGSLVHGAFFSILREFAPTWADRLHCPEIPERPFTISSLRGGEKNDEEIPPLSPNSYPPLIHINHGAEYWLRISSLQQDLTSELLSLFSGDAAQIKLGQVDFRIIGLSIQHHDRAGTASYDNLAASCLGEAIEPLSLLGLRFLSATTFRSQGRNRLFPLPSLIFPQLLRRWNLFCPPAFRLDQLKADIFDKNLMVSGYHLMTRHLRFGLHGQQLGFTGYCEYQAARHADIDVLQVTNLLWRFCFFSGIGYGTPKGMGQVATIVP